MAERELVLREDLPSNSHKSREAVVVEEVREKKVEKVVKGKVTQKKKSLGKKMAETFLEDDTQSVGEYILYDVLIPAAKSTLTDIVTGGIEMLLYGGQRDDRRSTTRDRGRTYVSYNRMYDRDDRRDRDRVRERNRNRHEFDDIFLDSKAEAREVLNGLMDLVEDYGQASVEDFYDLVGLESQYTDSRWGWTDLRNAYIENTRRGWIIRLPRTVVID